MGSLEGVRLKISRAGRHAREIEDAVQALTKQAFETVTHEFDPETGEKFFVLPQLLGIEDTGIGLGIGDFLHNARSALDHLAWQLVRHPIISGVAKPSDDDVIGFPICTSPSNFKSACGWKLKGAAPGVEAVLETLQPYYTGKAKLIPDGQTSDDHPLWLLHELNNWDKHRLLHVVANQLDHVGFLHHERVESSSTHPPGRLKAGAELARYKLRPGSDSEMDVGFNVTTSVTFQDGPGKGRVLLRVTSDILYAVLVARERLEGFVAI